MLIQRKKRAKPLKDLVTIVNLIGNTCTDAGLKVGCELDENDYKIGIKVSKKELENLNIIFDNFHVEWNYTIYP